MTTCREFHGPTYGHDNCPCCSRCGIDLMCESPDGMTCLCTDDSQQREYEAYCDAQYEEYCKEMLAQKILDSFTTA